LLQNGHLAIYFQFETNRIEAQGISMNPLDLEFLAACFEARKRQREMLPLIAGSLGIPENQVFYYWAIYGRDTETLRMRNGECGIKDTRVLVFHSALPIPHSKVVSRSASTTTNRYDPSGINKSNAKNPSPLHLLLVILVPKPPRPTQQFS
jgi:hypothetical protein